LTGYVQFLREKERFNMFNLISFLIRLFLVGLIRPEYSAETLTSYSHLTQRSAREQIVMVDFEDTLYYNESLDIPTIALIRKFTNMANAQSTIIKGFDMDVPKDVITLQEAFTSQGAAAALTLTLTAGDKDHMILGTRLKFQFVSTGALYVNTAVVVDKLATSTTTTISVKPYNYETVPTSLIGIDTDVVIPVDTKIMILPWAAARGAETVQGTSLAPAKIRGYFQDTRLPFDMDDITAMEKLYIKGTAENLHAKVKRAEFNRLRERAWLFNPPGWERLITTGTDSVQNESFPGLWTVIKAGTSRAKKPYDVFSMDRLDEWCELLDDSSLDNKSKVYYTPCNQALINEITKVKRSNPGIDFSPVDEYGIPGIKRYKYGSITLDLHDHWLFDKWFGSTNPALNYPTAMALTLPLISYKYKMKEHIRENLPTTGTKKLNEIRIVDGYLIHNINTAYWGLFYNTARPE